MNLLKLLLGSLLLANLSLISCAQNADSTPQFVFKPAPRTGIVANVTGKDISEQEMLQGIETQVYDLEKKLYDLKFHHLKALMIKKLIAQVPEAKGSSESEFLEKEVLGKVSPSQKQIDDFIKERKIPQKHLNEQLQKRIKSFLTGQLKEKAADQWLAKKSQKAKIEIYLQRPERPFFEVKVGEAPVMGGRNAKVTIVEFSDFECPFCSKGAALIKQIKQKFGNKVQVAFKHFPLPFHKQAKGAANASMCVHEQDQAAFWKFHDLMFENQSALDSGGLVKLAQKLKLDMGQLKQCIKTNKYAAYIEKILVRERKLESNPPLPFLLMAGLSVGYNPWRSLKKKSVVIFS